MKKLGLVGAAWLLASCNVSEAPADNVAADTNLSVDANVADANAVAPVGPPMSLAGTTWEFTDGGKPMVVSIDQAGAYILEAADGTHFDHGTWALKDGKDCFTSAMGEKATMCSSTSPEVPIGGIATSTDDKGVATQYTRVEYRALKLPG